MINTKSFTDQEIDILLDSLEIYEKTRSPDDLEYARMREVAEVLESQLNRQIEVSGEDISELASSYVGALNSFKREMILKEKEAITNRKIIREKITLLKAKLILLQQDRAVDTLFKGIENEKEEK
jgi:hypothetical protein